MNHRLLLASSALAWGLIMLSNPQAQAQTSTDKYYNNSQQVSLTVKDLSQEKTEAKWLVQNDIITITDIQINNTESGLQLIIDSDRTSELQPLIFPFENTLIVEFIEARLETDFRETDISEEITAIEGVNLENGGVRITITGKNNPPSAQIIPSDSNLVLSVTPESSVASEEGEEEAQTIELVVTANRAQEEEQKVPRSITVINRQEIEQQSKISRDLGEILPKLVPGLAPSTQTSSIFGQPLRGRNVGVLIDGVPQSTNRNAQRDLRNIDPSSIERIEILRGPSAIYGDGATGGLINIITRQAEDQPFVARSNIGFDSILTNFADSFGFNVEQYFGGKSEGLSYVFNTSYSTTGGFFDSEGDRIPPDPQGQGGLADLNTFNILGKIGYDIDENQKIQFSISYYDDQQNSKYTLDPTPSGRKAEARRGLRLPNQPNTENLVLNLSYNNQSLWGSRLSSQLYYRDYSTRFFPFDLRSSAAFGNNVLQSEVQSEKIGTRFDIDSPILPDDQLNILWGLDYFHEDSSQPADIFDSQVFARSDGLVFQKTGSGFLSPPTGQDNIGLFAQLRWQPIEQFSLSGGIRQEFVDVSVNSFTTLGGNRVQGGNLNYDATLFNIGGVYAFNDNINVFANFAQGFSIADVARALRTAPNGSRVTQLNPAAQKVDTYEVGIRGNWDNVQASLAYFYSYSDLGTTFDADFDIIRDPQRIQGIEGDINYDINEDWSLGGTLTWTTGWRDPDGNGDFDTPLGNTLIPPVKLTAYVENQTTDTWRNRLQFLYSGDRNPAGEGFDLDPVYAYFTADFISSLKLGNGELSVGIENLFNTFYYPNIAQIYGGRSQSAAKGMSLTVGYRFEW